MKIYFDASFFPSVQEYCYENYVYPNGSLLFERDIEYIESDKNFILLEDDIDREDFECMLDNWSSVISYIIDSIQEMMQLDDVYVVCDGSSRSVWFEVLTYIFAVEGL